MRYYLTLYVDVYFSENAFFVIRNDFLNTQNTVTTVVNMCIACPRDLPCFPVFMQSF